MRSTASFPLAIPLVTTLTLAAASELHDVHPPDFRPDANLHRERIRQHIFNREGFSKIVPPTSHRDERFSASGTTVRLQIRA